MASDGIQAQSGLSDLLAELTDSDIVIEVAGARFADRSQVQKLQDAVEASYRALTGSIPVQFEKVAVLEEVARGSLSLWLRVQTRGGAHDAAGSEESLLKFLARGTLATIAWMDGSPTLQLADLQQAIRVLAWGTSITTTAHPILPSSSELVEAIAAWQQAKAALNVGDAVRIITNNGSAELDLGKSISDPRTLLLARKLTNHSADMIFLVEMPDYQATRQWQLKHGGSRTTAHCEPGTLLDKFYRRELDIRPGDALRCKVDVETSYGPDHEVLAECFRIVEILEVLPASQVEAEPPRSPVERVLTPEVTGELEATP